MPNAKDIKFTVDNVNFFVVGGVGSGKTWFASSFPTPGFVFDFDKQITLYRGLDFDYEQYEISNQGWLKFEKDLAKILAERKYKSIIIDSMTSFQSVAMERALAVNPARNEVGGAVNDVHYTLVRNLIEGQIRKILSYVGYKAVLAHLEFDKNREGNIIGCHPHLVGALKTIFASFFGEILYALKRFESGKETYSLQTVNQGLYNCRSNLSGKEKLLPAFVPNDFKSIMEILHKRKEEYDKVNATNT